MHSGEDIPEAIRESGATAVYTGPVGLHPRVPELIVSSAMRALKSRSGGQASAQPAQTTARSAAQAPSPAPEQPKPDQATHEAPSTPREKRSFLQAFSSGTRGLRLVIRAAVVLVMLAILGVAALAFLVPEDTVREQVT
ncbi:TPA: hypothetical protein EYP38_00510, partial [Candidatus Micrarchaeota archaeon]|nr:hypothetical protein [Candidatus Micrarchaeota archaeon]